MKITIIGASAGVGFLSVTTALQRGHKVTALSRSTETPPKHINLTAVAGSATNAADVKKVTEGADAVIVKAGTGKSTKETTLYSNTARAIIQVQKDLKTNVPFIILTGFGAGNSSKYQSFFTKIIFALLLKKYTGIKQKWK